MHPVGSGYTTTDNHTNSKLSRDDQPLCVDCVFYTPGVPESVRNALLAPPPANDGTEPHPPLRATSIHYHPPTESDRRAEEEATLSHASKKLKQTSLIPITHSNKSSTLAQKHFDSMMSRWADLPATDDAIIQQSLQTITDGAKRWEELDPAALPHALANWVNRQQIPLLLMPLQVIKPLSYRLREAFLSNVTYVNLRGLGFSSPSELQGCVDLFTNVKDLRLTNQQDEQLLRIPDTVTSYEYSNTRI